VIKARILITIQDTTPCFQDTIPCFYGRHQIVWQLPSKSFIKYVLTNPFYAGAYVYGRRSTEKVVENGIVIIRMGGHLPAEQCRVFIPDHHEGYIGWPMYEETRKMISANSLNLAKDESVAAIRAGQGLLSDLLRCAHCGHKIYVCYWGRSGTAARYLCKGEFDTGASIVWLLVGLQ
jgi:hypothetical protein